MKRILGIVMILLMLMSVTVASAGNAKDTQTDRKKVIIGFVDTPNKDDEDMIRGHGGITGYTYHIINAKAVEIPEQAIDRIKRNPRVAYVEEDAEVHALDAELDNSWGVKRIGAGVVHDGGNTGAGVNVAIIDTGIDYTHPDLDANYRGGYDFVNSDDDPMDDNGHGTHCAGIVAAEDNDEGVVGVAPNASLYGVKVLDSAGSGYDSDVIAGIDWSVENGMQVISMSLGSDFRSQSLKKACDNAYNSGVLVVAAAGNDGDSLGTGNNVDYPARYSSVIAVAATDSNDGRAWFSSTGPDVELAAPGVNILSTYPGGYAYMNGTSMACPHVAGTAALVIATHPDWTNVQVRQQLRDTADDLGAAGFDTKYGYGLVDADEAALPTGNKPPVADAGSDQTALVNENVTFNGSGSYDIDGTITEYDWEFGDGTTGTGMTTTHAYKTAGTYTANLTVTDNGGLNDTDTVMVTVTEEPACTMHVASINMSTDSRTRGRNTFVWAVATVTIVDAAGAAVEGATVEGHWSNTTSDSDSGVTDTSGQVSLKSDSVKNPSGETTFTFTVDGVAKDGWTYNPNGETSDSITVP